MGASLWCAGVFFQFHPLARGLVVTAAIVTLIAPAASAQTSDAQRLERAKQEIAAIRRRLAEAKGQAGLISKELKTLDNQTATLDGQIQADQKDILLLESEIRTAEAHIAELEQRYRNALQASNERARRLYKTGPVGFISALFKAKSPGEFLRLSMWWEVAAELDGKVMLNTTRLGADLSDRKAELNVTRSVLANEKSSLEQRRQLVATAQRERAGALLVVQEEISAEQRHLTALEQEARRLTAVIRASLSRSTGEVSRSGFIWPLRGRITSGWMDGRRHTGIDIDGNTGDPIVAAKSGHIAGISCGSGYGICTIIDHGGGVATLYAHMSRKAVSGGSVSQGQVIGYVGCTGICYGSHLHFEVRVNGEPRNPLLFLP
jgi:murein DD-endopeptidase MepM/ murein hydrolase activator NlpD